MSMNVSLQDLLVGRQRRRKHCQGGGHEGHDDATTEEDQEHQQQHDYPRILILDGGVSTHLQEDMGCEFPHRQLWSSSLLMNENSSKTSSNEEKIRQGHLDWLGAGANILTTVTYQCHYNPELWPSPSSSLNTLNTNTSTFLSVEIMNGMYDKAIHLAQSAVSEYKKPTTINTTTASTSSTISTSTSPINRPLFVAVSMGCYGAALANGAEYTGDYNSTTLDNLVDFHAKRFQYLGQRQKLSRHDNVVLAVIETVPSFLECKAIAKLLSSSIDDDDTNATDAAAVVELAWLSLACRNGSELNDGTPVKTALEALKPAILLVNNNNSNNDNNMNQKRQRLYGIGFNCCKAQYLKSLVTILMDFMIENSSSSPSDAATKDNSGSLAIVFYPNSGEGWNAETQSWIDNTSFDDGGGSDAGQDSFSEGLFQVIQHIEDYWRTHQQHASSTFNLVPTVVVGGCCRTKPAEIAALRKRVDQHLAQNK